MDNEIPLFPWHQIKESKNGIFLDNELNVCKQKNNNFNNS